MRTTVEMRLEAKELEEIAHDASYRIAGDSLTVTSPENPEQVMTYRIEGDSLTLEAHGYDSTFRRVPDDS